MESILTSVKQFLGIMEECIEFDQEILICINSVFSTLTQIGVPPKEGFVIYDKSTKWSEYILDYRLNFIKTYMNLSVKMMFDPPTNSSMAQVYNDRIKELEWRIYILLDTESEGGGGDSQVEREILKTLRRIENNTNYIFNSTDGIKDNTDDIKSNTSDIKTNTDDIKTNTDNIESNTSDIKDNTDVIKDGVIDIKINTNNIKDSVDGINVMVQDVDSSVREGFRIPPRGE